MAVIQTLHPAYHDVLKDLSSSEKSIEAELRIGKAPGKWELMQALFPPSTIKGSVIAQFTFKIGPAWSYTLDLVVEVVATSGGEVFVLGYVPQEFLEKNIRDRNLWQDKFIYAAVRYDPTKRTGHVILSRPMFQAITKPYQVGF